MKKNDMQLSLDTFFLAFARKNTRDERLAYDYGLQKRLSKLSQIFHFLHIPKSSPRSSRVSGEVHKNVDGCIEGQKKMKKNSYGFSLIEVVIALLISSILGIALFTSFNQINKYATIANNVMSSDTRLATIHHQLSKDMAGAFIPVQALPPEENKNEQAEKKDAPAAQDKKPKPQQPAAEQKPTYKQLKKVFVSSNAEDNLLKSVTFITNNPLIGYGNSKPRIARVMYRLGKAKDSQNRYTLYRQESATELEAEKFKAENKKIREFVVAENIKHLSISYEAPQEDSDELEEFIEMVGEDGYISADDAVKEEEGTYNHENGHFLCTDCYIAAGMPSKPYPQKWVAP
jgi:prepilin-type N-terminal cleavage/methylation domain-containing protein